MEIENIGELIRQLREQAEMPLRKLAALLDVDQSTLSKLERGERPVNRKMLPIIANTFNIDEKELVIKFMSKQLVSQLSQEQFAKEILFAAEEEIKYFSNSKNIKK